MIGAGKQDKKIVVAKKDNTNETKAATRGGGILD